MYAVFAFAVLLAVAPACGKKGGGGGQTGPTLGVNMWIVDIDDYQGESDPNFVAIIDEFKRLFGETGISVGEVVVRELTGPKARSLSFIDLYSDPNENGLPDDMEELFKMSSAADRQYLNIFFVNAIFPLGVIGLSSSINGPAENGTNRSGVLINTFGGFRNLSEADLKMQGETIAHEAGHYLGLYHTTEKNGHEFDPFADTPECPAEENDLNLDGLVSADECENLDGPNLMFWLAAKYAQETMSPMQNQEMIKHPLVR
ncbi:hypothetical protein MNBD_NITROSPINAE04-78 [hydrothermal vent metagenome]|uniref:Peptidase M43 pregnancy-associated plasma-A domain-containing protein n=1 Tax=hydrothermal vent metagenome TaxID=652676 RepID=A0A3B1D242_9ZZZZ